MSIVNTAMQQRPLCAALIAVGIGGLPGQRALAATGCEQALLAHLNDRQLEYKVTWKGISLDSRRLLHRQADGSWVLHNTSRFLFMALEESSQFRFDQGKVISVAYDYQRKGMSKKRDLSLRFDQPGKIQVISPRGNHQLSYQGSVYDLLNHQIRLQLDLACSPPRQHYVYSIAQYKKVSQFDYRRVREETIDTPSGKWDTILLERHDGDQLDQIWFAPKLDYQIVHMVHHDADETAELSLSKKPVKVSKGDN